MQYLFIEGVETSKGYIIYGKYISEVITDCRTPHCIKYDSPYNVMYECNLHDFVCCCKYGDALEPFHLLSI